MDREQGLFLRSGGTAAGRQKTRSSWRIASMHCQDAEEGEWEALYQSKGVVTRFPWLCPITTCTVPR